MNAETKLTPDEEIRLLGNMLFATSADDAPRLLSITKRVSEIAAAQPGTVTDQTGRVSLEGAEPPMAAERKTDGIKIRLEPSLAQRLDKLCASGGRGRADVIRQSVEAVLRYFERRGRIEFPVEISDHPISDPFHGAPPVDWRIGKLRSALAGLVGSDKKEELVVMEVAIRTAAVPDADKAAMIDAILILIETAA